MAFATPILAALGPYATAIGIGGTALSAIGTISAANAAAASSEYNAQIADRNAVVADQNRRSALDQARVDAEDKRRENRRVLASIRASYGASGVELAGSPLDVLTDTAVEQELDAQRIEYEGAARGRESALQMLGLQESATLSRAEARSQRTAGYMGALGATASGVGSTLSRMN